MLLIDVGKLERVEAKSDGGLMITRVDRPRGYQVVYEPIKLKLCTDILFMVTTLNDDSGRAVLHVEPLNSTTRKFQFNYVRDMLQQKVKSYDKVSVEFKNSQADDVLD